MYDDLAQAFVFAVTAAYIILFAVLFVYFLRRGFRSRERKRIKPNSANSPGSTTAPS